LSAKTFDPTQVREGESHEKCEGGGKRGQRHLHEEFLGNPIKERAGQRRRHLPLKKEGLRRSIQEPNSKGRKEGEGGSKKRPRRDQRHQNRRHLRVDRRRVQNTANAEPKEKRSHNQEKGVALKKGERGVTRKST